VPAARAEVYVVDPGKTATVYLEYTGACAIDGKIEFSDNSIISSVQYDTSGSGMHGLVENGTIFLYSDSQSGVDGKIGVTITIHSGAAKGSSCSVTFRYAVTAPGSTTPGATQTITHTVTVRTDGGTAPTEPTTEPTEPPTDPTVIYADTSALREQINIAKNLTYYDYTKQTWEVVAEAVKKGESLLGSTSQSKVDAATQELKTALANLVPMDYTALQAALDDAAEMNEHEEIARLWTRFMQALENGRTQRTSGDQEAVDAATKELIESKEALLKGLEELGELVVVEKEVQVEVEPTYTFCNDQNHILFLIIMIISLVLNAVLITLIVLYFVRKNKREKDDTPLVEYDIEDDEVEINEDLLE